MDTNTRPRILHLEDSAEDAELIERELRRAEIRFSAQRVKTREAFVDALESFAPDIVLMDLQLPTFDGQTALGIVRERHPEIPVIMVTGAMGDERAVDLLKAGAADYVLKDRLARLGPAVRGALVNAQEQRKLQASTNALRASEIRYRHLFEAAKDGILILDYETGVITDANPFIRDLIGYSSSELLGLHLWDIGLFKDVVASKDVFKELQDSGYIRYEDLQLHTRDGRWIDVEFVSNTYTADDIRVIQCNVRDISERKASERSVAERDEILRTIAISVSDAIVMMDSDGKVAYWNKGATDLFGYSSQEAIGKEFRELLAPSRSYPTFKREIDRLLKSGSGYLNGKTQEVMALRKDGSAVPVDLSISAVKIKDQWHSVCVMRDVSERARLRESLSKALQDQLTIVKLKDDLVAVASHELRTPMSAIKGLISMILDSDFGPVNDALQEPLHDILESTERQIHLVNNMLDVYRLESNDLQVNIVETNIMDIARNVVKELQPLATGRSLGLALTHIQHRADVMVRVDPMKITEVLMNLIGNAMKFTDRGNITVELSELESDVVVRVQDTGSGIHPDDQRHLFGKFHQISNQEKGKPPGTGLGLYISKSMVEKMGGKLWLEHSALGVGSTFAFTLPLAG